MSARNTNKIVIWCSYFNQNLSVSNGRRINKKLALDSPTLNMLKNAAEDIGLSFEVEPDKAFPNRWWEREGRLVVDISGSKTTKTKILQRLAKQMRINESKKPKKEDVKRKPKSTKTKKPTRKKPKPKPKT